MTPLTIGIAALVVLLTVLYLLLKRPKTAPPNASLGVPIVGTFYEFAKSPVGFIRKCYDQFGSVYTVSMMGQNLTFLIGPEASTPFFKATDDQLSQPEVYGFMKPVFGADVVYDAAPPVRKQQMQNMSKGLRTDRLKSYVPKIVKETEAFLEANWGDSGELDILQSLSDLTILTASRCLHGDDVRENLFKEVSHLYHDLDQGITPLSFFFPNLPTAAHAKRDKARVEMVRLFSKVIESRRADPEKASENTDILQLFIDMHYKDGKVNTDDQITGLLIALLFAGQHTSSITSTWTSLLMLSRPEIIKRAQDELATVMPNGAIDATFDKIQKLELMHDCVREALRMHPPLIMLMRKAKVDVDVTSDGKKYTVPKGDIVITSPAVAMRLPHVFRDPDMFDPDRYGPGREEHKTQFSYLGFGGGMHACMGQQFGFMQVKTILSVIFSKYDLEPLGDLPEPDYTAMVVGPKGTPMVRYKKRA